MPISFSLEGGVSDASQRLIERHSSALEGDASKTRIKMQVTLQKRRRKRRLLGEGMEGVIGYSILSCDGSFSSSSTSFFHQRQSLRVVPLTRVELASDDFASPAFIIGFDDKVVLSRKDGSGK